MSKAVRVLSVLLFSTVTASCSNDREEDNESTWSTEEGSSLPSTSESKAPVKAQASEPLPSCPEGASIDPPAEQLELPEGAGSAKSIPARWV